MVRVIARWPPPTGMARRGDHRAGPALVPAMVRDRVMEDRMAIGTVEYELRRHGVDSATLSRCRYPSLVRPAPNFTT